MAKLYLSELSAVLAERHGIDRRVAQRFVTSVVAVVQSGLEADRMVKIKGLGTFKIIDVEARESVNVNTGERLVIDSHSKLTFLPDNAMKELVNKPFSQFDTVVLNDGVVFNDVAEEEETPAVVEEETPAALEEDTPIAVEEDAPIVVEEEAPAAVEEEVPAAVEEEVPTAVEDPDSQDIEEDEPVALAVPAPVDKQEEAEEIPVLEGTLPPGWITHDDDEEEEYARKKRKLSDIDLGWWHIVATALIALIIGGITGYWLGNGKGVVPEGPQQQVAQSVSSNEQPQATEEESGTVEEKQEEQQEEEDSTTPIWEKYNDMDPRTSSGYYYITGLDRIEKAKAGDNSARISRRAFGAVELACYIEVFNGIDGKTVLEEGTEVKIPKIEPKKTVKKRMEQQNNQQ